MRRQQLESIQQMLVSLARVYERFPQSGPIADVLERLAEDVKSEEYQGFAEEQLIELSKMFRAMELPQTRDEFEVRAALRMLLHELDRFLHIAKRLKKKKEASELGTAHKAR
ncbi:hypothetical protein D3C78_1383510 [compost metagenome]